MSASCLHHYLYLCFLLGVLPRKNLTIPQYHPSALPQPCSLNLTN